MSKKITFTLPAEVVGEATSAILLGEFNNWDYNEGVALKKKKDGSMEASISLEAGKSYQYRYLLNDGRWVNDHSADHYEHISGLHVENCVVNVAEETPKAPAKEKKAAEPKAKAPAKKAAPAKAKDAAVKAPAPAKAPAKPKAPKKDSGPKA